MPPCFWASVVWAGHVIYMAFIVGRLTGWHRLCSVPVDLTEWLPDGRKVLSSDFKSADISIVHPPPHPTHTSHFHPLWISSSSFFSFSTLFIFIPLPDVSDWCHLTSCARRVAADLCSIWMQTWIMGIITILLFSFPPCFYLFSLFFPSASLLLPHLLSEHLSLHHQVFPSSVLRCWPLTMSAALWLIYCVSILSIAWINMGLFITENFPFSIKKRKSYLLYYSLTHPHMFPLTADLLLHPHHCVII